MMQVCGTNTVPHNMWKMTWPTYRFLSRATLKKF
jgi:hypothetical protein